MSKNKEKATEYAEKLTEYDEKLENVSNFSTIATLSEEEHKAVREVLDRMRNKTSEN